jgi:hypothetical protein
MTTPLEPSQDIGHRFWGSGGTMSNQGALVNVKKVFGTEVAADVRFWHFSAVLTVPENVRS